MTPPDAGYEIDWSPPRRRDWAGWLAEAGASSLEQSWAYGAALAAESGLQPMRGVLRRDGAPAGIVQAFRRFLPGGPSLIRIVRGPLWLGPPPRGEALVHALRAVRRSFLRRRGRFLFWLPELPDHPASVDTMRAAGLRRVVTGYCSSWLDLGPDEDALRAGLRAKWRNQLRQAEKRGLRVERPAEGRLVQAALDRYDLFHRRARFVGPSGALVRGIAAAQGPEEKMLTLVAFARNEPVAAMFVARHGAAGTYYAGWTDEAGRAANAHNLLLWRAALALREDGVRWFDLGGLSAAAPGVAAFKLGTGAAPFVLCGTWF